MKRAVASLAMVAAFSACTTSSRELPRALPPALPRAPSPTAVRTPGELPPPAAPLCLARDLELSPFLEGPTGSIVGELALKNVGRTACRLGRIAVKLLGERGRPLARGGARGSEPAGGVLTLTTGQTAHASLRWSNYCGTTSTHVQVSVTPGAGSGTVVSTPGDFGFPRCDDRAKPSTFAVDCCTSPPPEGYGAVTSTQYPYSLRTHCGVTLILFDGRWWDVRPRLSSDPNNPPRGWDSNQEQGVIVLLSPGRAEFRSARGMTAHIIWHPDPPPPGSSLECD